MKIGGTCSKRAHKLEMGLNSALRNLKPDFSVFDVGISCSPNFSMQLELVQIQKMELISWRRACKKMTLVGLHFAQQFGMLLMVADTLTMPFWRIIIS
jgi:hypothetical protein